MDIKRIIKTWPFTEIDIMSLDMTDYNNHEGWHVLVMDGNEMPYAVNEDRSSGIHLVWTYRARVKYSRDRLFKHKKN